MTIAMQLPPIQDVLPHRGTMLMIDRLLFADATTATVECAPRANAWYADVNGDMPSWIGIELMAQTIAAHVGLLKLIQGAPPKQGALLGSQRYAATRCAFAAGVPLRIKAKVIYCEASGFSAYECCITVADQEVASATLKVFEPDDFQTFLQASL